MRCSRGCASSILASPEILKRGCDISCVRACVRRPGRKRDTESVPRHRSLGPLAVTNYINADGHIAGDCCIYREIEPPVPPAYDRAAALYQRPREGCAGGGIWPGERGGGPGITGHQSRESPASRRESATAPEAANPPPSSRFLFLHSARRAILPLFPPLAVWPHPSPLHRTRAFQRETTAPLVVFHRGPGEICKLR